MKLCNWLSSKKKNSVWLAHKLACTPVAARRYLSGERLPRPEIMAAIYHLTQGVVSPNDFYDLPVVDGERENRQLSLLDACAQNQQACA